jgi:hypothetical protein
VQRKEVLVESEAARGRCSWRQELCRSCVGPEPDTAQTGRRLLTPRQYYAPSCSQKCGGPFALMVSLIVRRVSGMDRVVQQRWMSTLPTPWHASEYPRTLRSLHRPDPWNCVFRDSPRKSTLYWPLAKPQPRQTDCFRDQMAEWACRARSQAARKTPRRPCRRRGS